MYGNYLILMNLPLSILLQDQGAGGGISGILMIVAMVVIFYFFMIRPQNKKQKELKKQREAMKKGDKVVSAGGIHGRIKEINNNVVVVEVAPGVVLKFDKGSIYPAPEETAAPQKTSKKADKGEELEAAGKGEEKK